MNALIKKLNYTISAIQDITKALEEKGFNLTNIELMQYGNAIRSIKSISDDDINNNSFNASYMEKKNCYIININNSYCGLKLYANIDRVFNSNINNKYISNDIISLLNNNRITVNVSKTNININYIDNISQIEIETEEK